MAAPQGLFHFPGVAQVVSASFTLSHGISPSVASLDIVPQSQPLREGGTLTITFGGTRLDFPNCRILRGSFRTNAQGQVTSFSVADRRWKWAFGAISGNYNILQTREPTTEDQLDRAQVRTARQLAILCLAAMGETRFNVAAVPDDQAPFVEWDNENPAQALAALCDQFGLRVVLRLDDSVLIAREGEGGSLPAGAVLDGSAAVDPIETPDSITVLCGKTKIQDDLGLRPVGLDYDGKVKSIYELSYRPSRSAADGGWSTVDPISMRQVSNTPVDGQGQTVSTSGGQTPPNTVRPRDLAKRTVWRWYQVGHYMRNLTDFYVPPGLTAAQFPYAEQLLPIDDVQLDTVIEMGRRVPKKCQVFGIFADRRRGMQNTSANTEYTQPFSINKDKGVVEFDRPVYSLITSGTGRYQTAQIYLRTTYNLRLAPTLEVMRHRHVVPVPGARWRTGTKILKHDEITVTLRQNYYSSGRRLALVNNLAEVQREIDYYAQAQLRQYAEVSAPVELSFAGIVPVNPDGAIQQVSWSVGGGGATTRASRNSEHNITTQPYHARRLFEQWRVDRIREWSRYIERARRQQPSSAT